MFSPKVIILSGLPINFASLSFLYSLLAPLSFFTFPDLLPGVGKCKTLYKKCKIVVKCFTVFTHFITVYLFDNHLVTTIGVIFA